MKIQCIFLGTALLIGIGMLIMFAVSEKSSEIGKCYDKNGNEIIGVSCIIEDSLANPTLDLIYHYGLIPMWLIGLTGVVIGSVDLMRYKPKW